MEDDLTGHRLTCKEGDHIEYTYNVNNNETGESYRCVSNQEEICNEGSDEPVTQSDESETEHDIVPAELNFEEGPLPRIAREKILEIEAVLDSQPIDSLKLKEFALTNGGLINDDIRKKVWPKLLGIDIESAAILPSQEELEANGEYHQVVLDVKRSLKRFPPGIPYKQRVALQDQLTRLILRVIIKYPHLRYYQGYHDVAVTFLLVVGEAIAFQIMEKLSTDHLKECMEPTMDKTSHLLNYMYPLIQRLHPSLYEFMERSCVGTMFCLPWFLTWYGHSLNQYKDVVRLYDYFLASPPLLPLYLASTLVVHRKDEIFAVDCDMASIHFLLSQIPDDLPFESLLIQATKLYEDYPPISVEAEVIERTNGELQLRKQDDARRRRLARRNTTGMWERLPFNRFVPDWAGVPHIAPPRFQYRYLIITATVVGLYAYLRMAEAVDTDSCLPVR